MKLSTISIALCAAALVSACSRPDFRAQYEQKCKQQWQGSGYPTRLVYSETGNSFFGTAYYDCQVFINGRWLPADNVRLER